MLTRQRAILSPAELQRCRCVLDAADWSDGNATSGQQSARAKRNEQLAEGSSAAAALGDLVLNALRRHAGFIAAALPLKVFPPLFSRYQPGMTFGPHIDNAVRFAPGGGRYRTDLAATLFLTDPDDYDGGELVIDAGFGEQRVKLPAGDMVLYPASSLHHVSPVTRGVRVASFFWIQSMVRDDGERAMLFQLDNDVQRLATEKGSNDATVVSLTGIYHNLLRRWADA